MAEYLVGQPIVLFDAITNPTSTPTPNAPTDDATDTVTVYLPDGTTSVPTPVTHGANGSGVYSATFTPTQVGWHEYVWGSTGAGAGKGRSRFYVSKVP